MTKATVAGPSRPLTVRNFGGISQVVVADDQDLARIETLDPARWAATSAPLADLNCDPAFLAFIDSGGKARIRTTEIVAARDWLFTRLAVRKRLVERIESLRLADLDGGNEHGRMLRKAAEHVLAEIGEKGKPELTLEQVRRFRATYTQALANGDGVICPEVIPDPDVAALVRDAIATVGGVKDLSGRDGVDDKKFTAFLDGAKAYLAWSARPAAEPPLLPWGPETVAAADMVQGLDAKIEEYFWVCDLLRQEAATVERLRLTGDDWKSFKSHDAALIERYIAGSPIASPVPEGKLPLGGGINPVYLERFEALGARVLARALGKAERELTRASWRKVKAIFEPYWAWKHAKPAEPYEKLGDGKLAALLTGDLPARTRKFIAIDSAAKAELEQTAELEKLILYQRWLITLVNNFVNFSAIYDPMELALVEAGSLVVDGRRLEFCVRVVDRAAHKKVASESLIFLVYAEIREKDADKPVYEVMAPVTAGERGRLRAGKRGIFVDVKGKEWDSIIVDVVENPISVIEAAKSPFKRAAAFIAHKIEDLAGSQLDTAQKGAAAVPLPGAPPGAPPPPPPAPPPAVPGAPAPPAPPSPLNNLVLYGTVAVAALGSAATFILSTLSSINPVSLVTTVAGLAAVIAALAGFLGWLKLRRRDMSLVLEANGWAVNVEMRLTRRIAWIMTRRPSLPAGTIVDTRDLLAAYKGDEEIRSERRRRIATAVLLTIAALLLALIIATFTSDKARRFVGGILGMGGGGGEVGAKETARSAKNVGEGGKGEAAKAGDAPAAATPTGK